MTRPRRTNETGERMVELLVWILGSYLLGSVPTSIVVSRVCFGSDIRSMGSGNAGATNVFRCLGWKPALFVAAFDIFKGWLPAFLAGSVAFHTAWMNDQSIWVMVSCGFAAVLGHTYTAFAGFKGGKGVGTGAGMLLALAPWAVLVSLIVFGVTLVAWGMVSLSSMAAALALPISLAVFRWGLGLPVATELVAFACLIPPFIIFTHRSNVGRIVRGTEHRFEKAMIFRRTRE